MRFCAWHMLSPVAEHLCLDTKVLPIYSALELIWSTKAVITSTFFIPQAQILQTSDMINPSYYSLSPLPPPLITKTVTTSLFFITQILHGCLLIDFFYFFNNFVNILVCYFCFTFYLLILIFYFIFLWLKKSDK